MSGNGRDQEGMPQPPVPAGADGPAEDRDLRVSAEAPSPDVDVTHDSSSLPGAHRGGFRRLPTAPVAVTVESAPAEPGTGDESGAGWEPSGSPEPARHALAGWALGLAIVALGVSLFVGWGVPLGVVAIVAAIVALRRPRESRARAVWAIAIGGVSVLYSAGWLLFAASSANLLA